MSTKNSYGLLLNKDIKLHRKWFAEMTKLLGINVIFRAPKPNKHYTTYTEINSNYNEPVVVGCIFDEHPTQQTLKKIGWVSELQKDASLIHVPYDLEGLQQGALFIVPSGLDNAEGRLFRVTRLTNSIVYPASILCEIVPEYEDLYEPALDTHVNNSMSLLEEEDDHI